MVVGRLWLILAALLVLCGCGKFGIPIPSRAGAKAMPPPTITSQPQAVAPPVVQPPRVVKPAPPPPLEKIPADLEEKLKGLGARINTKTFGYGIDIRHKPGFTDRDIDLIVQCPQVIDLTMENVPITDEGLKKLEALPKLSRLILNSCSISSEGLQTLAGLPLRDTMISLGLRGTKVTDADMTTIQSFPNLERLDVSKTAVTDAGLPALQTLPLEVLNTAETAVTEAGIKPLQQQLPKLVVHQ